MRFGREAIRVSDCIATDYDAVWDITLKALAQAKYDDSIAAISTCLVEHLLEHDFSGFDRLEQAIKAGNSKAVAALAQCWKFGQSKIPTNAARWDSLLAEYGHRVR